MAFGTWLKKAFGKVKDFVVDKALPAVKKVAGFVGKAAQPILGAVGSVVGGPLGGTISKAGQVIGGFANRAHDGVDSVDRKLRSGRMFEQLQPRLK